MTIVNKLETSFISLNVQNNIDQFKMRCVESIICGVHM